METRAEPVVGWVEAEYEAVKPNAERLTAEEFDP